MCTATDGIYLAISRGRLPFFLLSNQAFLIHIITVRVSTAVDNGSAAVESPSPTSCIRIPAMRSASLVKRNNYLHKSSYGFIIFTIRNKKTAVKLASWNVIEISEIDETRGRQLL
jgi:hypothetical protein